MVGEILALVFFVLLSLILPFIAAWVMAALQQPFMDQISGEPLLARELYSNRALFFALTSVVWWLFAPQWLSGNVLLVASSVWLGPAIFYAGAAVYTKPWVAYGWQADIDYGNRPPRIIKHDPPGGTSEVGDVFPPKCCSCVIHCPTSSTAGVSND